jgi:uncharacterized protein YbjQ (UPF0145 family)
LSDSKKDLTRIEDLGEYLHELNSEEENFEVDQPADLPELPPEESSFETTSFESESFSSSEESFTQGSEEQVPDFQAAEVNFNSSEDQDDFASPDFSLESSTEIEEETFSHVEPTEILESPKEEEITNFETPSFDEFPEEVQELAPISEPSFQKPETFEDLKKFAEHTSPTGMGVEGNPSFSVLLKDIKYIEDVQDILSLLKELGLLTDSEDTVKQRLLRGHLLVPRISEFAAIFLAHKLRRFDIDIQVGLSDEIHPPKHQEKSETGIVSKNNLYQNQSHQFQFENSKLELSQIILSTSSNLVGHQVIKYVGVASEHKILDSVIVENEASDEIPSHYSELANKLKAHAVKANANAIIGLSYQLTPIPSEYGSGHSKYRLSCTGNLVWVNRQ